MTKVINLQLKVDNNTERDHRILQEGVTLESFIEYTISDKLEEYGIAVSSIASDVETLEEELVYIDSQAEMSNFPEFRGEREEATERWAK
tara:strand:- start:8173 stop:8442 length:270 start_codon:yes stop_codon:yes gene_type:complete